MKRIIEFIITAVLFFAVTAAFLTVDKRSSEIIEFEGAFSSKKVEIFQLMH